MKNTTVVLFVISLLFSMSAHLFSQTGTFTVHLPKIGYPPDEEKQGWSRPRVWGKYDTDAYDDSIVVPNGRPIYALFVSGYGQNGNFDELYFYNFARYLMEHGAYVHYAWWNNLLAPYMERPLHYNQSDPGDLATDFTNFTTAALAEYKAIPGEDYQFVEDAKLFLSAIRENNPEAIIIVVGHSMGGGAVVHLASQTDVKIDILGLIDPVGNRNYPWAGGYVRHGAKDFNWTRWRITRSKFRGYKSLGNAGTTIHPNCIPTGNWLPQYYDAKKGSDVLCFPSAPFIDNPGSLIFGDNVVHLYYRYQKEYKFPFDYKTDYKFGHTPPLGFTENYEQEPVLLKSSNSDPDPGGWPKNTLASNYGCCPDGDGVGWPKDGHGEIVGYRGPVDDIPMGRKPVPLGVRVRTSHNCGNNCSNQIWPGGL